MTPDQIQEKMQSAIVVPLYQEKLTPDEQISLEKLNRTLGSHPIYLLRPIGEQSFLPYFRVKSFARYYFASRNAYSQLLLSREFYEAFIEYQYILIYQLDCLIFSELLDEWCIRGYDYIGAPFFRSKVDPRKGVSRAGNGGLSLRNVSSFLKVLNSKRYIQESISFGRDWITSDIPDLEKLRGIRHLLKKASILRQVRTGVDLYTSRYSLNEDHFWSDRAKLFYPNFKIAPIKDALAFSFEKFPQYCFEQNNRQLPFGCHAWTKWDREFWEPFL